MGKYEHSHVISQAKTGAGRRAVAARLPKIVETPKRLLLLKGNSTSAVVTSLLNELHILNKPHTQRLSRKNDVLPFETGGQATLERMCRVADCSLFGFVSHSKKRSHNFVLGRMFHNSLLDMVEFGVEALKPMASFPALRAPAGIPPLVVVNGADFDKSDDARTIRSLLLDLFRPPAHIDSFAVASISRVVVATLQQDGALVSFRQYAIALTRPHGDAVNTGGSGDDAMDVVEAAVATATALGKALPDVTLTEAGPSFDLRVRRVQRASDDVMRIAMRRPRDPDFIKKKKNVSRDDMGDKVGRVHVGRQDVSTLALARMKGLGKKRKQRDSEEGAGDGATGAGGEGSDEDGDDNDDSGKVPVKKVRFAVKAADVE